MRLARSPAGSGVTVVMMSIVSFRDCAAAHIALHSACAGGFPAHIPTAFTVWTSCSGAPSPSDGSSSLSR